MCTRCLILAINSSVVRELFSQLTYSILHFFQKKCSKNRAVVLAGRHLLCSQVAMRHCLRPYRFRSLQKHNWLCFYSLTRNILRSLRALSLTVGRNCSGRQRLATLKHVSGLSEHCSTVSLRRATQPFRLRRRITLAMNLDCSSRPMRLPK